MGVLWRCFYHLIWTTKHREPSMTHDIEGSIQSLTRERCSELGVALHAIGGTSDHIHIAAAIPPRLSISDYVRVIKGYTAHQINVLYPALSNRFQWQIGYGVLTFSEKHLDVVIHYIVNQKDHHAQSTLNP
jgi:REP element-mobilizing transposase RayT